MHVKRRLRRHGVALVAAIAGGLFALTPAGAAADFTWTGSGSSARWSDAGNWSGGSAPTGLVGTLAFPPVGPCPPCSFGGGLVDDIAGLSAQALSIDDSFPYGISGSALTLGAGGIVAAPTSHDGRFATVGNDILLGQAQTWTIAGDGPGTGAGLTFPGSITGLSDLTVSLNSSAQVFMHDVGVGTMTVTGSGVLTAPPGSSLNATAAHPVNVEAGASLRAFGPSSLGPLRLSGGGLSLLGGFGGPPVPAGTLTVNGSVTLDAASSVTMAIGSSAPARWPINDRPQINASGPIDLNDAHLTVLPDELCPIFSPGEAFTLVTTTSQLTGGFAGIPDGAIVPLGSSCPGSSQSLRINYGPHTVVGTVVNPGPSPTAIGISPIGAKVVTNQPVTLTATVMANYGTPKGTASIADVDNSSNIANCVGLAVSAAGSSGTARCRTTFAAVGDEGSRHFLLASYTPSDTTTRPSQNSFGMLGVTDEIDVDPATTATTVRASRPSTPIGGRITYTATVTPAYRGAVVPSGSLEFDDHGVPIGACRSRPLTRTGSTAAAGCTVTYRAAGAHAVTARYAGDANFVGSASRPATVVSWSVQALAAQLTPSNTGALRRALLRHRQLAQRIAARTAGTLTIRWYLTTFRGQHTLLASGHATYASAGKKTIELRLTPAGLTALSHARRIRVTASAAFVPRNAPPVAITRTFVLR